MEILDALARARSAGHRVALVTVLAVEGDVPSHAGAKLVVGEHGVVAGTLGCSEFDAAGLRVAQEALSGRDVLRRREVFAGQAEPRALELFVEVQEPGPAVLAFGATPVARALLKLSRTLGRRAVLVSPGGDVDVAAGVEVRADDPARALLAAPPGRHDALVITDHDASWAEETLRIALASDAGYVGMLGSRRHVPNVVQRLRGRGVPEKHLARLRSPCGLDIGSRTPEEIALAITAEVVAVERGRPGGPLAIDWTAT